MFHCIHADLEQFHGRYTQRDWIFAQLFLQEKLHRMVSGGCS